MKSSETESPTGSKTIKSMDKNSGDEHIISEDYQRSCHALCKGKNRAHLDHLRNAISRRESEIYKEEESSNKKSPKFSKAEMPD